MARNIEIKARLPNRSKVEAQLAQLSDVPPWQLFQRDTFFGCRVGRLKLREFTNSDDSQGAELIYYQRPDQAGPKQSFYIRNPVMQPDKLRESLAHANGMLGTVIKQRTVYLLGRTRVHLDKVEGLGNYLELEVVLDEGEPNEQGEHEARQIMQRLGIDEAHLEQPAYFDLLQSRSPS